LDTKFPRFHLPPRIFRRFQRAQIRFR